MLFGPTMLFATTGLVPASGSECPLIGAGSRAGSSSRSPCRSCSPRHIRRTVLSSRSTATSSTACTRSSSWPCSRSGLGRPVTTWSLRSDAAGVSALALGLATAAVLAVMVVRTEDATARPDGIELVGAVFWRGIVYGLADGLLLSVFPILVVFAAFAGSRLNRHVAGKVVIGIVALVASLAMTAVYHFGYSDFRSAKVGKPLAGDVVWSFPTLVTLNPIGAPIAHAGLHTAAVLHSYETDTFLPPHNTSQKAR